MAKTSPLSAFFGTAMIRGGSILSYCLHSKVPWQSFVVGHIMIGSPIFWVEKMDLRFSSHLIVYELMKGYEGVSFFSYNSYPCNFSLQRTPFPRLNLSLGVCQWWSICSSIHSSVWTLVKLKALDSDNVFTKGFRYLKWRFGFHFRYLKCLVMFSSSSPFRNCHEKRTPRKRTQLILNFLLLNLISFCYKGFSDYILLPKASRRNSKHICIWV